MTLIRSNRQDEMKRRILIKEGRRNRIFNTDLNNIDVSFLIFMYKFHDHSSLKLIYGKKGPIYR